MKIINLSELCNTSFYVKDISLNKIEPNIDVKNYTYKSVPVSHFTYGYRGHARYFDDKNSYDVTPETLLYIPTEATINFEEDIDYAYYKIYFNLYEGNTGELINLNEMPTIYFHHTPKELSNFLKDFTRFFSTHSTSAEFKFQSMFFEFIYILNSFIKSANNSHISSLLSDAVSYIQSNFSQEFSTKDLAYMCNLSEPYFRALFKKQMGITPTEYKNYLRIRRACDMLIYSNASISLISEHIGYNNLQYFCRTFKKIIGYSPLKYRQEMIHDREKYIPITLKDLGISTPIFK